MAFILDLRATRLPIKKSDLHKVVGCSVARAVLTRPTWAWIA